MKRLYCGLFLLVIGFSPSISAMQGNSVCVHSNASECNGMVPPFSPFTICVPADLPGVAEGVVSARLERDDPAYLVQGRDTGYQASNPRHGFTASFSPRGLVIKAGADEWRLTYVGYGDREELAREGEVAPEVRANRVEYRRGALTEWYVNGPLGLEQGFTVHEPLDGAATELSLRLAMSGSLTAVVDADGRGLALGRADDTASYRFGGLVASDAGGRSLNAHMRVGDGELVYTVDLADAQYPVVIDPQFTGGPSVRVTPNVSVEFKWITDVSWFGEVAVYDNPDGTGAQVTAVRDEDALGNPVAATQHTATIPVGPVGALAANTGYFFRVTATDPTGSTPRFSTPTPLPPFFTGTQAISNVQVESITTNSAVISWNANVIGLGSVMYGTTALDQGPVEDGFNVTNHAIELTGLSAGTTYQFRVRNNHAIDGTSLAEATGEFTTTEESVPVLRTTWGGLKLRYP